MSKESSTIETGNVPHSTEMEKVNDLTELEIIEMSSQLQIDDIFFLSFDIYNNIEEGKSNDKSKKCKQNFAKKVVKKFKHILDTSESMKVMIQKKKTNVHTNKFTKSTTEVIFIFEFNENQTDF